MIPSRETLASYVERGLVKCQRHPDPSARLTIYNYSSKVQHSPELWDDVTRACRGLILEDGQALPAALPWPKFFNYGEPCAPPVPAGTPEISEKMDGSLGILYRLRGKVRWATRGSFTSPQARAAEEMWAGLRSEVKVPEGWTVLAEIIHPTSRVVVPYEEDRLVILGARDRFAGVDVPREVWAEWARLNGLEVASSEEPSSPEAYQEQAASWGADYEGVVLAWPCGTRLKVKGDAYKELHKAIGGLTKKRLAEIWEAEGSLPTSCPEWTEKEAISLWREWSAESSEVRAEAESALQWASRTEASAKDLAQYCQSLGLPVGLVMGAFRGGELLPARVRRHVAKGHGARDPKNIGKS